MTGRASAPIGLAYGLALLVVTTDQLSKSWASANLRLHESVEILPVLSLTLMHNEGAAFSMLSDAGGWQRGFLAGLAIVLGTIIAVWIHRLPATARMSSAALGLVLGGAVGNLADRLRLGHVVDFIDLHYRGWHWPAFNVADAAITIGAILLIVGGIAAGESRPNGGGSI